MSSIRKTAKKAPWLLFPLLFLHAQLWFFADQLPPATDINYRLPTTNTTARNVRGWNSQWSMGNGQRAGILYYIVLVEKRKKKEEEVGPIWTFSACSFKL